MIAHRYCREGQRVRLKRGAILRMSGRLIPAGTVGKITQVRPMRFMDGRWYIWVAFEKEKRGAWLPLVDLVRLRARKRPREH